MVVLKTAEGRQEKTLTICAVVRKCGGGTALGVVINVGRTDRSTLFLARKITPYLRRT